MSERDLFLAALDIDDLDQRARFLVEQCGADEERLMRLKHLILAKSAAGSFLESAPAPSDGLTQTFGAAAESQTADFPGKAEHAGAVIAGKYTLVEVVGEGGMGSVWRAKQTEPVKRFVAVKLIKAGMDSKQVLARFEAERQALALMDHPNIAKVLDGGLHEHRPYFVMELVKGVPITEYCDKLKLTPKERLELFVPVCQAIQHAHQKGIIHRDIKPSNVLIALYDDRPVVKVIDFGVAKATGGALTEHTIDTGFGGVVGTPQYMSPEQATFNNLDVDTRSDVYALGVLLYELLTGTTPFSRKELEKRGLLEILRVVREEEPPRPSTKLSTADALPTLSANRGTEPKKLTGLLRNELDWIVMKALEKDRARRYETANGFAADVLRYLGGEAVQAHPPSTTYRVRKFARRNRAALAAAAAVAVAVLAGLGGSAWQAVRATRAERLAADRLGAEAEARAAAEEAGERARAGEARAVTEARRAAAVADLLQGMLESANPEAGRKAGVTVRDLLDQFAAGLDDQLRDQPEVEATVREVIGRAYWRLGLYEKAGPQLERAVGLRRRTPGTDPAVMAAGLVAWGRSLEGQGKTRAARAALEEALALHRRAGSAPPAVIQTLLALLMVAQRDKRDDEGDRLVAEAREAARALPGGDDPGLACMLHVHSSTLLQRGRPAEAEVAAREGVGMHRRTRRAGDPELGWGQLELGRALHALRRSGEAEATLKEAWAVFRVHFPDDEYDGPKFVREELQTALIAQGRGAEAEAVLAEYADQLMARAPNSTRDLKGWLAWAEGLQAAKQWDLAGKGYREAARLAGPGDRPSRVRIGVGLQAVADGLREQRKLAEAVTAYREAAAELGRARADDPADSQVRDNVALVLSKLGWTLGDLGRHAEAIESSHKGLALWKELRAAAPDRLWYHHEHALWTARLAGALLAAGLGDEAEAAAREGVRLAVELYARDPNSSDYANRLGWARAALIALLDRRGDRTEAIRVAERARAEALADTGPYADWVLGHGNHLGALYRDDGRPAEALAVLDDVLKRVGADDRRRGNRRDAHRDRARAYADLGRHAEADEDWVRAVELADGSKRAEFRSLRAVGLVQAGRVAEGTSEADDLARGGDALTLYNAACVHALVAGRGAESGRPNTAPDHARRAIELLRQAAAKGYASPDFAAADDDFAALYGLPEFRAALAEMGKPAPGVYSGALAVLGMKLLDRRDFSAAEPVTRECLGLREKEIPDDWRTANARALLGGALLGQKKYADAEPLLVKGYEGMKQREKAIPPQAAILLPESIDRLIELSTAMNKPDDARKWRAERAKYPSPREAAPPPREKK